MFPLVDWPSGGRGSVALVVNPTRAWWNYLHTAESALRLKECGWTVFWFDCSLVRGFKEDLYQVNEQDKWPKLRFRDPALVVENILASSGIRTIRSDYEVHDVLFNFDGIDTLWDLNNIYYENVPVGGIVAASISGQYFTRYFSVQKHKLEIDQQLSGLRVLTKALNREMLALKPDLVVTTNDRIAPAATALSLARSNRINTLVAYWGAAAESFMVYRNSLYSQSDWRRHVESVDEGWLGPVSDSQLVESVNRATRLSFSMSRKSANIHAKGRKKRIVVYTSTPWEYSAALELETGIATDQIDLVRRFLSVIFKAEPENLEVIIRHHPASATLGDRSEWAAWEVIRQKFDVMELGPFDQTDSYELARSADLCVVWRSTIGPELMLRGCPVIALDDVYWLEADSPFIVRDEAAMRWVVENPPTPPPKSTFLKLMAFQTGWGVPLKMTSGHGFDVKINGERVFQRRLAFATMRRGWKLLKAVQSWYQIRETNRS